MRVRDVTDGARVRRIGSRTLYTLRRTSEGEAVLIDRQGRETPIEPNRIVVVPTPLRRRRKPGPKRKRPDAPIGRISYLERSVVIQRIDGKYHLHGGEGVSLRQTVFGGLTPALREARRQLGIKPSSVCPMTPF